MKRYEATVFVQGVTTFVVEAEDKENAKKQILTAYADAKKEKPNDGFDLTIKACDLYGEAKVLKLTEQN